MNLFWYAIAALGEIGGCFSFWAVLRLGKGAGWAIPGIICLTAFAVSLTRIDSSQAGRAYAAYGGVYIAASLLWLWIVEGTRPDHWDLAGAALSLAGTFLILYGPRPRP